MIDEPDAFLHGVNLKPEKRPYNLVCRLPFLFLQASLGGFADAEISLYSMQQLLQAPRIFGFLLG